MIRTFSGEYLTSPAAVHLGLNWCSHNCYYCFANLNRPNRRADYAKTANFIRKVGKQTPGRDLGANLAMRGHPVLASNVSDPFSTSNADAMEQLIKPMMDAGIRLTFQTRGGNGALETLTAHPPTMVYITLSGDREDIRRTAEPGTPTHQQRLELMLACKERGHFVIAGLNPFYPPWWTDIEAQIRWLKDNGITHVWAGEGHLNYMQVRHIRPSAREKHAQAIADFSLLSKKRELAIPIVDQLCTDAGINTFYGRQSTLGGFWDDYFALGYPFFPTIEGWYDKLWKAGEGRPVAFTFGAFHDWAAAAFTGIPETSAFKEYLMGIGRSLRNDGLDQAARNIAQVHEYLWKLDRYPTAMRDDYIAIGTQDGHIAADGAGRPLLVYTPGVIVPDSRFDIDEAGVVLGLE